MTKNVTITSPTSNGYDGADDDAVPGAILTYTIDWKNVGSIAATTVNFKDELPDTYTNLSGNVIEDSAQGILNTINYLESGTWFPAPAPSNSEEISVNYDLIPVDATGNLTYRVIIK
jgi:uncharacterized repeat protein (TIGR01451 family)